MNPIKETSVKYIVRKVDTDKDIVQLKVYS